MQVLRAKATIYGCNVGYMECVLGGVAEMVPADVGMVVGPGLPVASMSMVSVAVDCCCCQCWIKL